MKMTLATLLLALTSPVWALSCGDWVFSDVVLRADLRDCPAEGLVVAAANVKIDLNGHTIDGKGRGTGISVLSGHHKVAIVGNGTIRQFATGIAAGNGTVHTIRHPDLQQVDQGIYWTNVSDSLIEQVTITPQFNGITLDSANGNLLVDNNVERAISEAIWIRAGSDNELWGNQMLGNHTAFAISGGHRNRFEHNSVFDNAIGVIIAKGDASIVGPANSNWIIGNKIYNNTQGIFITAFGDSAWMKYNRIERNAIRGGSSGLTISAQNYRTEVLDNNFGQISGSNIFDNGNSTHFVGNHCDGLNCP